MGSSQCFCLRFHVILFFFVCLCSCTHMTLARDVILGEGMLSISRQPAEAGPFLIWADIRRHTRLAGSEKSMLSVSLPKCHCILSEIGYF